jgi:hypothetical protein
MPELKQSLLGQDLGHLRIIAEHWGIQLEATEIRGANNELTGLILGEELLTEVLEALPPEAFLALAALQKKGGRLPWSQFTRRFGEVREMGPGKRDRDRPDRDPASVAEVLWYRALIGRAFFDTGRGTEEFAYIPNDLLDLIPAPPQPKNKIQDRNTSVVLGRAATAAERATPVFGTDRILDHACTLLAGHRMGLEAATLDAHVAPFRRDFVEAMIQLAGLLDPEGTPAPEATRAFLEAPRGEALASLAQTWLDSGEYNDLHHVPNLQPEGAWMNDPLQTRRFIWSCLAALPQRKWWCLSAFIADIRQQYPDFQRPAGDYDSWFLRDTATGEFLRGFEHWDAVDGSLVRYLINGPLHWLGLVDLAAPSENDPPAAFRFSQFGLDFLAGKISDSQAVENAQVHIRSDGRLNVPVTTPRAVRYQLARFCQWEEGNPHEYRYRLSPSSLTRAREAGLRVNHLLSLLTRHTEVIPPNILTALNRWEAGGTQARVQEVTILKLGSPQMLEALRASRAARFLGEPLGPTTIVVKTGAAEKVLAILVEMGYLGEIVGLG